MDLDDEKLEELYHQVIRVHDQNPYKFGDREQWGEASAVVNNPMCGDQYKIWVVIEDEVVKVGGFHGYGCSISKAAGSVLLSATDGRSKEGVMELLRLFLNFIENGERSLLTNFENDLAHEILAFIGVQQFPSRKKCAVLIASGYLEWLNGQG